MDLTVNKLEGFNEQGVIDFDNSKRKIPEGFEIDSSVNENGNEFYSVEPFKSYIVRYNETISVPDDCMGLVMPRSSLMRCGATMASAWWDPGYSGKGVGLLFVLNPFGVKIYRNSRIAQIVFFECESNSSYQGQYQNEGVE